MQRNIKTGTGSGIDMVASMRIGTIESVLHSWLIPWLEQLRIEQPQLGLNLTVEITPTLNAPGVVGLSWSLPKSQA
jgi:hypothetical protein